MLGNFFMLSLSSADIFQNRLFEKTLRVSNSLDPDRARHFVGPDLCPNCLLRLSTDAKSRGVKSNCMIYRYVLKETHLRHYSEIQHGIFFCLLTLFGSVMTFVVCSLFLLYY